MQESKEHIKTRILKNAAKAWGYPETERENNFDPLVAMLMEACASELEKISGEIHASRSRVLERLVQLLSPDELTGALPAHAVARALPVEDAIDLQEDAQLYARLKLPSANEAEGSQEEVFFSPTGTFHLKRASIRYMATGCQLFKIGDAGKEVVARCSNDKQLPSSTLWLGIDEPGVSLHNSLFYFDLHHHANKQLFYHQLPKARWFINAMPLQHFPGYGDREICGEKLDIESLLNNDYNIGNKIKKHINTFYKSYFITIYDNSGISVKKESNKMPDVIVNAFTGKEAGQLMEKPLRWISIRFPDTVTNHVLQDVSCTMNCFPVINRKLHHINYKLQEFINIIPLNTDDTFLHLQEVTVEKYIPLRIYSSGNNSYEPVAMLMRNGGIGRFDERDAAATIDYLLQLLQDESAAFSIMDKDFVGSEIKQLNQVTNKLEQKLTTRHIQKGSTPYLVINSDQKLKGRNLVIKYWSTNGNGANNIKAGTGLQLYKGNLLQGNTALLVSPTRGGRDQLSATEKVMAYKSALLSKDRLITVEDIKAFCYYQLGDNLQRISIQKGVMILRGEQEGYKRTLDVIVELNERAYNDIKEKEELHCFWEENLKQLLEEKSAALINYRVIVKQAL